MQKNQYDAIVIGAGNGGMTGALTLQKAGLRVLLLEQHDITGGCGSSFVRGRFEFETGLHQLYGIGDSYAGDKGALRKLFEELGVWDKITFVRQEEAFRLAFKGMGEIALPGTRDTFVSELQDFFGPEAAAIEEYQLLVEKTGVEFMRLYDFVAEDRAVTKEEFPCFFEYGVCTGLEMLNKYFENAMLKGVYQCLYGYLGIPIERIPFPVLAALYEREGGTWNVHETSMSMSNALTNTFLDIGGVLKLNARVTRIRIEGNEVRGVETQTGESYSAGVVLCNANRINAYVDMIDNDLVPEEVYADLRVSAPSQSIFGLNIGLDCTAEEAGIANATSFLMPSPGGKPKRYDVNLRQLDSVPLQYLTCYNIDDKDYSPEGTCVLTTLTSKLTEPFAALPPERYFDAKFAYAEKMLDYLYDFYPKVKDHIEEIEIFTPMTIQRYIGSQSGAIYGVDSHIKDLIATKLNARSPFKGLYFCGASFMFGGFHTTMMGGNTAARVILNDLRKGVTPAKHDFGGMKGIDRIAREAEACRTYNVDHRTRKGRVRSEVNRLHPDSIRFRITDIRPETKSAKTIRLSPTEGYVPPFVAGQYINLSVCASGVLTSRAYSISSPPAERQFYEITVRESKDGFVSSYLLNEAAVGDIVTSSGPAGQFYRFAPVHGKKLCFIAGGSGITPFMSMLQNDAIRGASDDEIVLIYGCAREDDMIFADRLNEIGAKLPNFRLEAVISEPTRDTKSRRGLITAELIRDVLGKPEEFTFFLCGPQAMYDFVLPKLDELSIPKRRIRTEIQSAPADPRKAPGWPQDVPYDRRFTITLTDGRTLPAIAGESVLVALERAGIVKKNLCRSGECGVCRSRLTKGVVFHPGLARMRKSDMRYGYIHPCVSYPISDLTLMI
ncbi:MAG: NAD(P)-binding protein [Clostridiales Family XIII bacterium]|nr:NAD(P)-binding protein [Clostridiales Family XIII bacterium]